MLCNVLLVDELPINALQDPRWLWIFWSHPELNRISATACLPVGILALFSLLLYETHESFLATD